MEKLGVRNPRLAHRQRPAFKFGSRNCELTSGYGKQGYGRVRCRCWGIGPTYCGKQKDQKCWKNAYWKIHVLLRRLLLTKTVHLLESFTTRRPGCPILRGSGHYYY